MAAKTTKNESEMSAKVDERKLLLLRDNPDDVARILVLIIDENVAKKNEANKSHNLPFPAAFLSLFPSLSPSAWECAASQWRCDRKSDQKRVDREVVRSS